MFMRASASKSRRASVRATRVVRTLQAGVCLLSLLTAASSRSKNAASFR